MSDGASLALFWPHRELRRRRARRPMEPLCTGAHCWARRAAGPLLGPHSGASSVERAVMDNAALSFRRAVERGATEALRAWTKARPAPRDDGLRHRLVPRRSLLGQTARQTADSWSDWQTNEPARATMDGLRNFPAASNKSDLSESDRRRYQNLIRIACELLIA